MIISLSYSRENTVHDVSVHIEHRSVSYLIHPIHTIQSDVVLVGGTGVEQRATTEGTGKWRYVQ